MTTPETTNSYEQNRLDFMAKQLEKNNTPRELTIKYILSHDQERKTQAAKEEAENSERIARRSLFAVIKDRDQLKEENDQLKAAAAINEQAAALQLEAVANDRDYQKTLLENERASWGKITRQLYAKLDDMEEQRVMYKHLYYTRLDEVAALMDKLNAIQAIINPDQTQESE